MLSLVTGAAGFIGRHLTLELLAAGHEVIGLDLHHDPEFLRAERRYRTVVADCTDPVAIDAAFEQGRAAFAGAGVDTLFHLAGVKRAADPELYHHVNTGSTETLLDRCSAHGVSRFLLMSSLAAVGPGDGETALTESTVPRPANEYGRSKLAAERLVHEASLDGVVVRAPVVYGPGIVDSFMVLIRLVERRLKLLIGDGVANFAYVADLAAGTALAGTHRAAPGNTYFVAHPRSYRYAEVYDVIAAVVGRRPLTVRVPMPVVALAARLADLVSRMTGRPLGFGSRNVEDIRHGFWRLDVSRAHRELGFEAAVDLPLGVERLYRWYRSDGRGDATGAAA